MCYIAREDSVQSTKMRKYRQGRNASLRHYWLCTRYNSMVGGHNIIQGGVV